MSKKQKPILKQSPWRVISYSSVQNIGEEDEFDAGFIELYHRETNKTLMKEMSWLKGEGPYKNDGFKTPTLNDIWDLFIKYTPGTTGFIYKDWRVKRDQGCFVYVLIDSNTNPPLIRRKEIIGDFVSQNKTDFASFLMMLDNIQSDLDNQEKKMIFNLDEARKKREPA